MEEAYALIISSLNGCGGMDPRFREDKPGSQLFRQRPTVTYRLNDTMQPQGDAGMTMERCEGLQMMVTPHTVIARCVSDAAI